MDPREFHKLATRLATGSSAAELRTATGRAYYAAFNVAADHLGSFQIHIKRSGGAHGEVQHCLANSGDPAIAKIGSDLTLLHSQRNRADYQLSVTDVEMPVTAQSNVRTAQLIVRTLDAAFRGAQRASLQAAITQWRRENGYP